MGTGLTDIGFIVTTVVFTPVIFDCIGWVVFVVITVVVELVVVVVVVFDDGSGFVFTSITTGDRG